MSTDNVIISIELRESDLADIVAEVITAGDGHDLANANQGMERGEEWADAIAASARDLIARQLRSVITWNTP